MRHLALFVGLLLLGFALLLLVSPFPAPLPARALGQPAAARSPPETTGSAVAARPRTPPAGDAPERPGLSSHPLLAGGVDRDLTLRFTQWAIDRDTCESPRIRIDRWRGDPGLTIRVRAERATLGEAGASWRASLAGDVRWELELKGTPWLTVSSDRLEMTLPRTPESLPNARQASFSVAAGATIAAASFDLRLEAASVRISPEGPLVVMDGPTATSLGAAPGGPASFLAALGCPDPAATVLSSEGGGLLDLAASGPDHRLVYRCEGSVALGSDTRRVHAERATLEWTATTSQAPAPGSAVGGPAEASASCPTPGALAGVLDRVVLRGETSPITWAIESLRGSCHELLWDRSRNDVVLSGAATLDLRECSGPASENPGPFSLAANQMAWRLAEDSVETLGPGRLALPGTRLPRFLARCIEPDDLNRGARVRCGQIRIVPVEGASPLRIEAASTVTIETEAGRSIGQAPRLTLEVDRAGRATGGVLQGAPGDPARLTPTIRGITGDVIEAPSLNLSGTILSLPGEGRLRIAVPRASDEKEAGEGASFIEISGPAAVELLGDRWSIHEHLKAALPMPAGTHEVVASEGLVLGLPAGEAPSSRAFVAIGHVVIRPVGRAAPPTALAERSGEMLTALFPPGRLLIAPKLRGPF